MVAVVMRLTQDQIKALYESIVKHNFHRHESYDLDEALNELEAALRDGSKEDLSA